MKTILFAAAAAVTLAGGHVAPVLAQDYDVAGMQQGLNMLELNVANIFAQHRIDADPRSLDLAQIAEIISRVNDGDDQPSRSELEVIINRN